jgi:hypothetical protein
MKDAEIDSAIRAVAREVQAKLDRLYAQPGAPAPDSALAQEGLRDGFAIVDDYLRHGEWGVAFEHLQYMNDEPGIALSPESTTALKSLTAALSPARPK